MRTTAMTEVIELISAEASQLQNFLAGLDTEEWSRPSACAGWTVGDVVAHLTQGARTWSEAITRTRAGDCNPPPGQPPLRPGERGSAATAQRAIDFRQGMGEAALLQAFVSDYQRLHQVLLDMQSEDWYKACFHRRGVLPIRDYVGLRLQELAIHGWDMRIAFDDAAVLSERPLSVLMGLAQRWLSNTFHPAPRLTAPVRYRFDVSGHAPLRQDVLVSQDNFHLVPVADIGADVTFHCHTGDYILLVYGRLPLDRAMDTGRLEIEGNREQAFLFHYRNVDNPMRNYHDIAAQWRAWGVTPDKRIAFYCGTGWRASEAFFYAYLMGWTTIAVYDGGWWAWVQNPANPIAVGNPSSSL